MQPLFEQAHIHRGQKVAERLMKDLVKDDPRPALIGTAMAMCLAAQASGVGRKQLISLITTLDSNLHSGIESAVQSGLSSIIIPGR